MLNIENYIGGELVKPASGSYLENIDPANGSVYSLTADSDDRDVDLAVSAATSAFNSWATASPADRHDVLVRIADLVERNLQELALAESVDNGKPVSLARSMDIPRAVANLKFYATASMHTANESYDSPAAINYTLRQSRRI
jgi:aminomuconate-semialdehyde/2-hydroxymuconate-6-semialdehyde dehydrogenase